MKIFIITMCKINIDKVIDEENGYKISENFDNKGFDSSSFMSSLSFDIDKFDFWFSVFDIFSFE